MIDNLQYVVKIIEFAQKMDSYWELDQSESNNGTVKVCSPIYVQHIDDFFIKRVYDYKECYESLLEHFGEIKSFEEALKEEDCKYHDFVDVLLFRHTVRECRKCGKLDE